MKHLCTISALAILVFATSCSKPPRFLFLNRSGRDIVIELPQKKIPIADAQFVELYFDPSMVVSIAGVRRAYPWRYPLPAVDYMEFGRPAERFAVSLEADGKIYARKIFAGKPMDAMPTQPAGFPLAVLN
jgi:hypothetical protein